MGAGAIQNMCTGSLVTAGTVCTSTLYIGALHSVRVCVCAVCLCAFE